MRSEHGPREPGTRWARCELLLPDALETRYANMCSVSELVLYDQHGRVARRVAITQNEHDSTKWRLAEAVTLGLGESEQAFIVRDGQEPVPLGPSFEGRRSAIRSWTPRQAARYSAAR